MENESWKNYKSIIGIIIIFTILIITIITVPLMFPISSEIDTDVLTNKHTSSMLRECDILHVEILLNYSIDKDSKYTNDETLRSLNFGIDYAVDRAVTEFTNEELIVNRQLFKKKIIKYLKNDLPINFIEIKNLSIYNLQFETRKNKRCD